VANPVQIQTSMRSHQDGISVTNHIYLVTSDPVARLPQHPNYDQICHDACTILSGIHVDHRTMLEIWRCIYQVEGYGHRGWQAILAKENIPDDYHGALMTVMARANQEYFSNGGWKLSVFLAITNICIYSLDFLRSNICFSTPRGAGCTVPILAR